jgi:hypothetical protein
MASVFASCLPPRCQAGGALCASPLENPDAVSIVPPWASQTAGLPLGWQRLNDPEVSAAPVPARCGSREGSAAVASATLHLCVLGRGGRMLPTALSTLPRLCDLGLMPLGKTLSIPTWRWEGPTRCCVLGLEQGRMFYHSSVNGQSQWCIASSLAPILRVFRRFSFPPSSWLAAVPP